MDTYVHGHIKRINSTVLSPFYGQWIVAKTARFDRGFISHRILMVRVVRSAERRSREQNRWWLTLLIPSQPCASSAIVTGAHQRAPLYKGTLTTMTRTRLRYRRLATACGLRLALYSSNAHGLDVLSNSGFVFTCLLVEMMRLYNKSLCLSVGAVAMVDGKQPAFLGPLQSQWTGGYLIPCYRLPVTTSFHALTQTGGDQTVWGANTLALTKLLLINILSRQHWGEAGPDVTGLYGSSNIFNSSITLFIAGFWFEKMTVRGCKIHEPLKEELYSLTALGCIKNTSVCFRFGQRREGLSCWLTLLFWFVFSRGILLWVDHHACLPAWVGGRSRLLYHHVKSRPKPHHTSHRASHPKLHGKHSVYIRVPFPQIFCNKDYR